MQVKQISLEERLDTFRSGYYCQEECTQALIGQWAHTPIKAYLSGCPDQLYQLYAILGLDLDENPDYQDVAERILALDRSDRQTRSQLLQILAAPVWTSGKRRRV